MGLASPAPHCAPKNLVAAFRTCVPRLFVPDPSFSSEFPSIRDRPQNDLFANGHGKAVDVRAGKIIALVTTGAASFFGACPDLALPAMQEKIVRQAPLAVNIFCREVFAVREGAFSWNPSLVQVCQSFLQPEVIVSRCDVDGADAAVQAARRSVCGVCRHSSCPPQGSDSSCSSRASHQPLSVFMPLHPEHQLFFASATLAPTPMSSVPLPTWV